MRTMNKYFALIIVTTLLALSGCSQDESDFGDAKSPELGKISIRSTSVPLTYTPNVYIDRTSGVSSTNVSWKSTGFIPVDIYAGSSTIGVYGVANNSGGQVVVWYDENQNFIKADMSQFESEFVTPRNAAYIRVTQNTTYTDVPFYLLYLEPIFEREEVLLPFIDSLYYNINTGIPASPEPWKSTYMILTKPFEAYIVEENNGGQYLLWFDKIGLFLGSDFSKTDTVFTAPATASFLVVSQDMAYSDVPLYKPLGHRNLIEGYRLCRNIDAGGVVGSTEDCGWKYTDFIRVSPLITYQIPANTGGISLFWYDNSNQFISQYSPGTATEFVTPPTGAAYARILQNTSFPDVPIYRD